MSRHLLLLIGLVGCVDNDLPPGSFLDRDRVLGARIEVSGAADRASPLPGETVRVRWIMADPAAQSRTWMLGMCAGTVAGCTTAPLLLETGSGIEPSLTFVAPTTEPGIDRLWIVGEIDTTKVAATVPLTQSLEHANHNPSLADAAFAIGDSAWPTADAPAACDPSLPVLRVADAEVELAIAIDATDRETYTTIADDGTARTLREELQLSHFTTIGTLDRQFSVLDGDESSATVRWIAPDVDIPVEGLVARFVIVLRDGRGGLDATTRFACIVP